MEKKRNYNENHPELEEGEMFLTNSKAEDYNRIGWKTKRRGRQGYTINGEEIRNRSPIFIQREEYEEGMKKYE